jgi:hypothetical protein
MRDLPRLRYLMRLERKMTIEHSSKDDLPTRLMQAAGDIKFQTGNRQGAPYWWGDVCAEAAAELNRLTSRLASVTKERDELKRDAERLNWLETNDVQVFESPGRRPLLFHYFAVHKLRDLIDSALSQGGKQS